MESSFFRVKFAFRDAVQRQDLATLKMLSINNMGATQIRKVMANEFFHGFTPLQRACLDGNKDIASFFVDYGVDVERRGKYGWTALHAASFACRPRQDSSVVSLLLNSCANVVARDEHGCLPVDLAENGDAIKMLLAKMEEKGHSELAEMYRKINEIKNAPKVDIVVEWFGDKDTASLGNDDTGRIGRRKQDLFSPKNIGATCFYTSCRQRDAFFQDRPVLRRERGLSKTRAASWNVKGSRDSGISVDGSDSLTFI